MGADRYKPYVDRLGSPIPNRRIGLPNFVFTKINTRGDDYEKNRDHHGQRQ